LLASDLGKMVDRLESESSVRVVKVVLLARMRVALMDWTCVSISDIRLCIRSLSCTISSVTADPGMLRIRNWGRGYCLLAAVKRAGAHQYIIATHKFVKVG